MEYSYLGIKARTWKMIWPLQSFYEMLNTHGAVRGYHTTIIATKMQNKSRDVPLLDKVIQW